MCTCVHVCIHIHGEDVRSPGAGGMACQLTNVKCWGQNHGPLQEQQVPLTAETTLEPLLHNPFIFKGPHLTPNGLQILEFLVFFCFQFFFFFCFFFGTLKKEQQSDSNKFYSSNKSISSCSLVSLKEFNSQVVISALGRQRQ